MTDPDQLVSSCSANAEAPASMPTRALRSKPRPQERFLNVRIPWGWLTKAMSLPGKALHVSIHVWDEVGRVESKEVSISMTSMAKVGGSRFAASRGLQRLEAAGLVAVVRQAGRKPIVTVLEYPPRPKEPTT
jgi:hypothetical protein